jgi:hypothetical protein
VVSDDRVDLEIYEGGRAGSDGGEELLVAGPPVQRRESSWARALRTRWGATLGRVPNPAWAGFAIAVVVTGVLVHNSGSDRSHAERIADPAVISAPPTPVTVPTPATDVPVTIPPTAPSESATESLDRLIYLAETAGPLQKIVPDAGYSACPAVPAGGDPVQTVTTQLAKLVPTFTVNGSSMTTLNPTTAASAALCGLTVRATDPNGSVLLVQILAPPHGSGPQFRTEKSNDRSTALDVVTVSDGWRVEVGCAGETGAQLGFDQLETVARDVGLRW